MTSPLDPATTGTVSLPSVARYRPYPDYKDSGVPWFGKIPGHWEAKRLKLLLSGNDGGVWGKESEGDGVIVLRSTEQTVDGAWRIDAPAVRRLTKSEFKACRLIEDDLVLTKSSGSTRHIGKTSIVTGAVEALNCCYSNFMQRLRTRPNLIARFAWYVLNGELTRKQFNFISGTTTGLANLNGEIIGMVNLACPPTSEQRTVAAFLDRETARIDALVARHERLFELLNEKRFTLIARAVTKGVDFSASMRDSGIEWMGKIPAHWEVKRTKHAARLESGHTPSRQNPEYWQDCDIPWFGLADVWQIREGSRDYVTDTKERVSSLGLAHSSARLLPRGTVILSRTASVGFSGIMGTDMATTQDFVNWVCHTDLLPEYLLYVFRSMVQEFQRVTMGSTHQTIYMPDVGRFSVPLPPMIEQEKIVEFIRIETDKIDALVARIREAIGRLRELRIAVISAAVTGKIDVRELT